jgi:hypothetical protein
MISLFQVVLTHCHAYNNNYDHMLYPHPKHNTIHMLTQDAYINACSTITARNNIISTPINPNTVHMITVHVLMEYPH